MARVKRGVHAAKKRRTTLERAAGYRGQRSRLFSKAKEQVTHSLVYAFNDAGGGELPGMIISFDDDEVSVDFNHPLSGRTILFDVLIHRVEPAELH